MTEPTGRPAATDDWGDFKLMPVDDWAQFNLKPGAPAGTPAQPGLSAEAPDISATGAPVGGEDPMSVAAQVPQHMTNAIYKTISAPGDLTAMALQGLGLRDKAAPLPSDANRGALGRALGTDITIDRPADTPAKQAAAMVGDTLGEVASTAVPFGFGARAAAKGMPTVARGVAESMGAQPGAQVALTGASNVAAPAIQDSDLPEFTKPYAQMAVPFALGGMAHMGQRAVSAAPAANTQEAERRSLLEYGRSIGGTNTAGKITGNEKLQTLESANSKLPLPFVGGRVTQTELANRDAFQAEALRKAGDTTGATAAPPSVTDALTDKLGDKFNFLTKNNELKVDPQFGADIAKAKENFSKQLRDQMPEPILKKLDELEGAASARSQPGTLGVIIDGETYQNIRSKLSAMLKTTKGNDTQAVGGMIDALDGLAERSLPKDTVSDFKEVRQQWRNLLAIKNAVGSANNPQTAVGNIPTAAYARNAKGNKDIETLGRYGASMVGDKVSNTSRTASHLGVTHLAGALAGAYEGLQHAPMLTMGALGASTIPFAFEGMMNNPATRAALLARYRNPSGPLIAPGTYGALAGQQALKQGQ